MTASLLKFLLIILVDLYKVLVSRVPAYPLTSKSSVPFNNHSVTVPRALITIGINITFMFHSFLIPKQSRSTYPSFRILTILLCGLSRSQSPQSCEFSLFLLIIIRSGRVAEIRWSVYISKSQWSLCMSFSRRDSGLYIYYLFVWLNFNFLHNSQWITLPTQSCLVLYSFWANLQHYFIIWLVVSSLSPHNLHLLFCCVLSILALIWLVIVALFCAAIKRYLVSLLRFPFLATSTFSLDDVTY